MSEPYWEPLAAASPPVSYGLTLPANPYDGQEAILVDSLVNPQLMWRFRYNAGFTGYQPHLKWEFIGGAPMTMGDVGPGATLSLAANVVSAWAGQTLTLPREGLYEITFGAWIGPSVFTSKAILDLCLYRGTVSNVMTVAKLIVASQNDAVAVASAYNDYHMGVQPAGSVYGLGLRADIATSYSIRYGWLHIIPKRVA